MEFLGKRARAAPVSLWKHNVRFRDIGWGLVEKHGVSHNLSLSAKRHKYQISQ